ncbi:EAL domain-containing protein, partial [Shewanella chilikensis]|uniref:EAL domain-containing protein n=1 Tax=Shewanella chilikensis TaxID=558541 RepID=UPI001F3FFED3
VRTLYENIKQLDFINDYIFINIERSHLCDNHLISEIIRLSFILKEYNSNLVVEVTERDHCGSCARIIEGIKLLRKSNIMLAIDDFDIYKNDLSDILYNDDTKDLFDIVKINIPEQYLIATLNKFVSECDKKIIVEMVETEEQLEQVKNISNIWGVQGYIYDRGVKF